MPEIPAPTMRTSTWSVVVVVRMPTWSRSWRLTGRSFCSILGALAGQTAHDQVASAHGRELGPAVARGGRPHPRRGAALPRGPGGARGRDRRGRHEGDARA